MATAPELFDLSGKAAIVTGAGSGPGIVFSEALAEAGADVACADIDLANAERTAERIRQRGRRAIAIASAACSPVTLAVMAARTVAEFGRLDILVNNAGIATVGPAESMAVVDRRRTIDVNLTGVFIVERKMSLEIKRLAGRARPLASLDPAPLRAGQRATAKGGAA